jgi:hypothetical protein
MNVHLVKDELQRLSARGSSEIYKSYFFEPRGRGIEDVGESQKRRPVQRLRVDNLAGLRTRDYFRKVGIFGSTRINAPFGDTLGATFFLFQLLLFAYLLFAAFIVQVVLPDRLMC